VNTPFADAEILSHIRLPQWPLLLVHWVRVVVLEVKQHGSYQG
jgi:hypothetical protein